MALVEVGVFFDKNGKIGRFLKSTGMSFRKLLRVAFDRLCERFLKEKKVSYTYNPLPEKKREKFGEYIKMYFRSKADFSKQAGLDPTVLSSLLVNRRCGNALTWKKINDAFEKNGINLPSDLKIKYAVVNTIEESNA